MKPSLRPLASTTAASAGRCLGGCGQPGPGARHCLASDFCGLPASPCTRQRHGGTRGQGARRCAQHHAGLPACIARCAKPADPRRRRRARGRIQCAYRRPRRGGCLRASPLDGRIRELEDQIAAVRPKPPRCNWSTGYLSERSYCGSWHRNARRPPAASPRPHRRHPTRRSKSQNPKRAAF